MSLAVTLMLLLIASTLPAVVRQLYPPLAPSAEDSDAGAVVVLSGGAAHHSGRWMPNAASLRRLAHGLTVSRQRDLPMLISGGDGDGNSASPTEALLMHKRAHGDPLPQVWLEEKSHNTYTNALYSAELLAERGISRVVLVTDREHMTRAMMCFRWQGIEVIASPIDRLPVSSWAPSTEALALLPYIWHEWLGLLWYQLRY